MQKILAALRASQRPVIFLSPFVSSHHENFDRLFFREIILDSLEEILIPSQSDRIFLELSCGRTEVDVTNLPAVAGVAADHHEQALSSTRSIASVRPDPSVISQRSALENVVPGSHGESWNVNVGVVFFDRPALPIGVVVGVLEPVEEVGRKLAGREEPRRGIRKVKQRIAGERKLPHAMPSVCVLRYRAIEGILCKAGRPRFVEPLFEGAALVSPSIVI